MQKFSITEAFASIKEHWKPRIAGELNGQHVKLVTFQGEFIWHHHENEDELFLVLKGVMRMEFRENGREQAIDVREGEFIVVPRGVEHRPSAQDEAHVMLFEPVSTLNTGNVRNERTVLELDRIPALSGS
jgi:mannose-6-phosphate isomerase-like protein (cupin superfamily)